MTTNMENNDGLLKKCKIFNPVAMFVKFGVITHATSNHHLWFSKMWENRSNLVQGSTLRTWLVCKYVCILLRMPISVCRRALCIKHSVGDVSSLLNPCRTCYWTYPLGLELSVLLDIAVSVLNLKFRNIRELIEFLPLSMKNHLSVECIATICAIFYGGMRVMEISREHSMFQWHLTLENLWFLIFV